MSAESVTFRLEVWPELLNREQAAAYLSCSPRTIDNLQAENELVPVNTGYGKRFPRRTLDRFVQTRPEWDQ